MYYFGEGVQENVSEAVSWFRRGADLEDPKSEYALGTMYTNGEGVQQNQAEGVRWYSKAATKGYAQAQFGLGRSYYLGSGVTQDYEKAAEWTQKAGKRGYARAQTALGWMYYNGEGVSRDHSQAVIWFRKAAEKGNAYGQINLAFAYAEGTGVPRNISEAIHWFYKAGLSFLEEGDQEQALAVLMQINEIDPAHYLAEDLRSHIFGEELKAGQPVSTSGEEGDYISDIFQARIFEVPKMAWLVPPDIIITDEHYPGIYLYSDANSIQECEYLRSLSKDEIKRYRKKHTVACDSSAVFHQYKMSGKQAQEFGFPDCVFYTSKAFPGAVRAGYSFGVRGKRVIAVSIAQAELETREFLHKYFILLPVDSHYSFSFHGFYSDETRVLFKKGLILHQEGEVLAAKFWQISEETMCDGCPLPLYRNEYPHQSFPDMVEIFSLLNVFSFSGFPYPVILLDTSNVEGRAISFVTFNQEGKYSEYRLYEYIVDYAY